MEIVYSVTVSPDREIEKEFIDWLKGGHIDDVVNTGCFDSYRFYKILEEDETQGSSYNIQYVTTEMSRYFDYVNNFAPELKKEGIEKFGDKFVAYRTILKKV